MTTAFEKMFGHKVTTKKKGDKRLAKRIKKRQRRVIRKLEAERTEYYVRAIVARGLAFKADVRMTRAHKCEQDERFTKSDCTDWVADIDLRTELQYNATVRRQAKKRLARKGVQLDVNPYSGASFICKPGHL